MGTAGIYPYGQPSYTLDPNPPPGENAVENIGAGTISGMNIAIGQGSGAKYQMQFWKIRVQGVAPGGSTSRLEVAAGKFTAS